MALVMIAVPSAPRARERAEVWSENSTSNTPYKYVAGGW